MSTIDKWASEENGMRRREEHATERARTTVLASQLSAMAMRECERALTGMVALPAAAALCVAATATYGVALLERAFEVFEGAVGGIGGSLGNLRHEGRSEARADRAEARA
jgi:hypothetical protein